MLTNSFSCLYTNIITSFFCGLKTIETHGKHNNVVKYILFQVLTVLTCSIGCKALYVGENPTFQRIEVGGKLTYGFILKVEATRLCNMSACLPLTRRCNVGGHSLRVNYNLISGGPRSNR
jgi:hypothetical protein